MLRRLMAWWRRRNAARFSYVGHPYLTNMWECTLCHENVHASVLTRHARQEHGFTGAVIVKVPDVTVLPSWLTDAERASVLEDLRRLRSKP